jgi:hypothetical protein
MTLAYNFESPDSEKMGMEGAVNVEEDVRERRRNIKG